MDTRTILFFKNVLEWQWTGPERTGTTGWGGTETNLDRRRLEMSEKENNSIVVSEASGSVRRVVRNAMRKWILALAALAALVFVPARSSHAQAQASASSAKVAVVEAAAGTQAATPNPVAASILPAEQSAPKGQLEGIKVHGHWTIEVKNPDGSRVSRQEFENSLDLGGAQNIAMQLLGGWVPGGFSILLADAPAGGGGPCAPFNVAGATWCYLESSLINPTPSAFFEQASGCTGSLISPAGPCFPLTAAPLANQTGFVISGTAVASRADQITDVFLQSLTCPANPFPVKYSVSTVSPSACAQGTLTASPLTHATLSSPVPILAAGQTIAVTVQISFQ
jgi:hypothetical protein